MPFAVVHQTSSGPIPVATFEALRHLAIVARLGATRLNAAVAKPLVEDGFAATIAIVVPVRLIAVVTHLALLREHGVISGRPTMHVSCTSAPFAIVSHGPGLSYGVRGQESTALEKPLTSAVRCEGRGLEQVGLRAFVDG